MPAEQSPQSIFHTLFVRLACGAGVGACRACRFIDSLKAETGIEEVVLRRDQSGG